LLLPPVAVVAPISLCDETDSVLGGHDLFSGFTSENVFCLLATRPVSGTEDERALIRCAAGRSLNVGEDLVL